MKWDESVDQSQLQVYQATPIGWLIEEGDPHVGDSFSGLKTLATANPHVIVSGRGRLRLDFGAERAGWFEFDSPNLPEDHAQWITLAISEYTYPWQGKTRRPLRYLRKGAAHGMATYRLETNKELYEGVRYAWLSFEPPSNVTVWPWTLAGVRVVCRIKPVNYTASYLPDDAQLAQVWYQGAYAARLNMEAHDFNSILMDRGDRVSIQGDGHPTMAAALTAFGKGAFALVATMLNATDSSQRKVVDDNIMAYPIYWTMSVNDYWWASGDEPTFLRLVPDVQAILDKAAATFYPDRPPLVWMGWDDRLSNGWCGTCNEEAQLAFATLLVRAHHDFGRALRHAGRRDLATRYEDMAHNLTARLRAGADWPVAYGLHAASNAINAEVPTAEEARRLFADHFNDTTAVCSWSPFNQYWILQAIGNVPGLRDYALASVRLCWGTQLRMTSGCFLELWDPQWAEVLPFGSKVPTRPSYCHPWSSGVTHWLTEDHVGLRPLSPGYRTVLAMPHVSAANPRVSGGIETPHGRVHLDATYLWRDGELYRVLGRDGEEEEHRKVGRRAVGAHGVLVRVELASAVPCVLAVPTHRQEDGCRLVGFRVGGMAEFDLPRAAAEVRGADAHTIGRLHRDVASSLGYSSVLSPGDHVLDALYDECRPLERMPAPAAPYAPFGPAVWRAHASIDRTTRGDWRTAGLGRAGYVLFGFDGGADVAKLPAWCINVTATRRGFPSGQQPLERTFHGTAPPGRTNRTFLQSPQPGRPRALGSVGDECADGCQGTLVDVNVSGTGARYTVSLYLAAVAPQADGPGHASQLAIRAMDLATLSPLAKLPLVRDFEGGVLWRLTCDVGVRLRVMPVYGGATVSAVLLDESA